LKKKRACKVLLKKKKKKKQTKKETSSTASLVEADYHNLIAHFLLFSMPLYEGLLDPSFHRFSLQHYGSHMLWSQF